MAIDGNRSLSMNDVASLKSFRIPEFSKKNALVVGDVMLDCYLTGDTSRISPEAPVPVVHVKEKSYRPGGAANVACGLSELGLNVSLLGIVGKDEAGQCVQNLLYDASVKCHFEPAIQSPTIVKNRVMSKNQQILRFDEEARFSALLTKPLLDRYKNLLKGVDVVVLSDYCKGTIDNPSLFIQTAMKQGIPICTDPKNRDLEVYRGATIITPNSDEFALALGEFQSQAELEELAYKAIDKYDIDAILVTQDKDGMTLCSKGQPAFQIDAYTREVYDVTGAGDTVLLFLSAGIAAGAKLEHAAMLANIAAGISVTKLGACQVSLDDVKQFIKDA